MSTKITEGAANIKTVLAILNLSVKYGIPAVTNAIIAIRNKDIITLKDIENLEMQFKDPKSYFKGYKE